MEYAKNKSCRLSFFEYTFCFLILWSSGTLFTTDNSLALYLLIAVFLFMVIKREILVLKQFTPILCWTIVFMTLSVSQNYIYSNGEGLDAVIKNYLIIICVFLFVLNKPEHNVSRLAFVVKCIVVISLLSNALYLYHILGPGLPMVESSNLKVLHFHYLFSSGVNTLGVGFVFRNSGIYWEPGMYQVFLTFAMLFYLYYPNIRQRIPIIVYLAVTAISTFSVSAYAVMAAILGIYVIRNNSGLFVKFLVAVAFIVALFYAYPLLDASMEAKQETGSYEARSNDLFFGMKVFLQHPILGCGIVNDEYAKASFKVFHESRPDSNGMVNLLINLGVVGASLVIYYLICFGKWIKKNVSPYMLLGFLAWIVLSSNTEPIVFHPFFEFLVGIGISYTHYIRKRKAFTPVVTAQ